MNNKLPNITTKTGDSGTSRLWSGETLSKDNFRFFLLGKLDTLSAQIGICKATAKSSNICFVVSEAFDSLSKIQSHLVRFMGEIATTEDKWSHYYKNHKPITDVDIDYLDRSSLAVKTYLEGKNYKIDGWVSYGDETLLSAHLDMSSKLCREAECFLYFSQTLLQCEALIKPEQSEATPLTYRKELKTYINRLSDYLYWLARMSS